MQEILNRKLALVFLVILSLFACENEELTTGLEGIVFKGPINPVEIEGQINDAPFSALFHVYNLDGKLNTTFSSNNKGEYKVMLAPGNYRIIPDKSAPIMGPTFQVKEAAVNTEGITNKDFYFDTGIR